MDSESIQKDLYNNIFSQYELHYDDPCSQRYRREFVYSVMFKGIDFSGKKVLEAMCGSGQATGYLSEAGAQVTGLDISDAAIQSFQKRWPGVQAVCGSILETKFPDQAFDCVVVVGGLHHIHPHVSKGIREITRVLKKGGSLCFFEPHSGSLPDLVRRFWYRHDSLMAANEAAIDVQALKKEFGSQFDFLIERYAGNLAYLFVYNSLVFRIPLGWKRYYTPVLMPLERVIGYLQRQTTSCFTVCQWVKK